MKFNFFKKCEHEWELIYHIGGDIQNTAYKCAKCKKRKVSSYGSVGRLTYDEIYIRKLENKIDKLLETQKRTKYFIQSILDVNPGIGYEHISHLHNCIRVIKRSAEKALKNIEVSDEKK